MLHEPVDIAIVGAGAAGLMTAIAAARAGDSHFKILLLDTRQKVGAKILISGGTRCNVTNVKVTPKDYEGGPKHFIKHVLEAFTPDETREFFEKIGVKLVLEPTGKFFPVTHSGKTVLEALLKEVERREVVFKTGVQITSIQKSGENFELRGSLAGRGGDSAQFSARRVVLATGGLSYPETGSDGKGLEIAKSFGHTVIKTLPALTPLTTDDEDWKALSGITLDLKLSFYRDNKKEAERTGSFLFTHFGFSGPAALDISRFVAGGGKTGIAANFFPLETEESLRKHFEEMLISNPGKQIKNFLIENAGFAARFAEVFLKKIQVNEKLTLKKCPKAVRGRLIHALINFPLSVTGVVGYKKAEVTAGGVDLNEVAVSTMESKVIPGLYFAGEILDSDGRIGGFNFQWAWSTGVIAGRAAARNLKTP